MTDDQIKKLKRNGQNNHLKIIDRNEKEKNDSSLYVGCSVQIIDGSHKGLTGKIIKFENKENNASQMARGLLGQDKSEDRNQYVAVELSKSGAIVNVKRKRLVREEIWNNIGKRKHDQVE